jgi:uncharacterized protein
MTHESEDEPDGAPEDGAPPATHPDPAPVRPPEPPGRFLRGVLLAAGFLASGLAILGAFLPLIPATPFLLLAAACFARSSPRLQRRLLASPVFGKYLEQWQRERTVPRAAKRRAYALVVLSFGLSSFLVDRTWQRVLLVLLGVALLLFLSKLPTPPREE